jgi:hypothetical protein
MEGLEKRCIIGLLRERYRRSRKKGKGPILDELCLRLGVGRKHGIKLLSSKRTGRPRKPGKVGRPSKYQDAVFREGLRLIWRNLRYCCGRTLRAATPLWIGAIELEYGAFRPDVRAKLLQISAATIDRILRPYKAKKGRSYTRSGGFRDEIPIQGNIWDIGTPGHLESDTAALCGGSLSGEFANALTLVDIATLWTETRMVFGKGSNAVFDAVRDIEHNLPFDVLGYDSDNGGEVLNLHIYDYFYSERIRKGLPPVSVTRSRAYQKNDNAHVEQRNDSLVRKFLGYERFEFKELIPLLNHYYANVVCPLVNYFIPSFKLAEKKRIKSTTRRIYATPVTPYQRLIESPYTSELQKLKLSSIHAALNPVQLTKEEKKLRLIIDVCLKRMRTQTPLPPNLPAYQLWMPTIPEQLKPSQKLRPHHSNKTVGLKPHGDLAL